MCARARACVRVRVCVCACVRVCGRARTCVWFVFVFALVTVMCYHHFLIHHRLIRRAEEMKSEQNKTFTKNISSVVNFVSSCIGLLVIQITYGYMQRSV